jgi:hypothetical protein
MSLKSFAISSATHDALIDLPLRLMRRQSSRDGKFTGLDDAPPPLCSQYADKSPQRDRILIGSLLIAPIRRMNI